MPPVALHALARVRKRDWLFQFIGLNPSTADEVQDDPTVRSCINFAKSWGFGALCMTNIFAYRSTDPRVMKAQADPIGVDNDRWLKEISEGAGLVVAAWGTHGAFMDRGRQVAELIGNLDCLDLTKDGFPKHPLYIRADIKRKPFMRLAPGGVLDGSNRTTSGAIGQP
jgi:hypothetical protein